jgi:3-deoxy-manno-octulosonate cytidylyltransferase (CMP-KDO synthetase)
MSVVAIIPARMASTRFPGKPLKTIWDISMIEHVRRRVCLCSFLDDVIVATCDREIADEVSRFGGKIIMTSPEHPCCVDRVAEAARSVDADIIINVQGDMPFVHPDSLEQLVCPLQNDHDLLFSDMMGPIFDDAEVNSSNVVKVVVDKFNNALYYSRETIPSSRKASQGSNIARYKQFGINAFRRDALKFFLNSPRTLLEEIESVDMLRPLENGFKIRMISSLYPVIGVDTPQDLEAARKLMVKDSFFPRYRDKGVHF